jgi:hypothetical protein
MTDFKREPSTDWIPTTLVCPTCERGLEQQCSQKTNQALQVRCPHGCYRMDLEYLAWERRETVRKEQAEREQRKQLAEKARKTPTPRRVSDPPAASNVKGDS